MSSEIKFRGKRVDNGQWVYGCAAYGFANDKIEYIMPKCYFATRDFGEEDDNGNPIIEEEMAIGGFIPINPSTVGQYTGLKDIVGKEIYEGDIVHSDDHQPPRYAIEFIEGGFCATHELIKGYPIDINHFYPSVGCAIKVIGNIHDNPESFK